MRRAARAVLTAAVRGRKERGGPWGEAALAEFDQTTGRWQAVRWASGGLRAVWLERRAHARPLPRIVSIPGALVTALLAAFLLNQFVLSGGFMASGSMEPTIPIAGRFMLDKVGFRVTGIDRGDIVEFTMPGAPQRKSIKRVIGLPGDTIDCRAGLVHVDGVPLDEPYLQDKVTDCTAVTVPADSLFVLGDHRLVSQDSRQWGPIPRGSVDGRLLLMI